MMHAHHVKGQRAEFVILRQRNLHLRTVIVEPVDITELTMRDLEFVLITGH